MSEHHSPEFHLGSRLILNRCTYDDTDTQKHVALNSMEPSLKMSNFTSIGCCHCQFIFLVLTCPTRHSTMHTRTQTHTLTFAHTHTYAVTFTFAHKDTVMHTNTHAHPVSSHLITAIIAACVGRRHCLLPLLNTV